MTIRTRLTLLFAAVVAGLLLLFCVVIYVVAAQHRANEFRERLRAEAQTAAELLLGTDPDGPALLRMLDQHHMTVLNQEAIFIYDNQDRITYRSGPTHLPVQRQRLEDIRRTGDLYWQFGSREVIGITFTVLTTQYIVVASAIDKYGFSKQRNLALILAVGWVLGIGIVFTAGWFFAGQSLRPLQHIIGQIDAITASQLNLRLAEGKSDDELTQLTQRFNRMLDRLEEAFQAQRAFVANASHEIRTPLTAITGQLDVALLANDDDPQELRALIASVLDDVRGLNRMTNGLLSLAKLSLDESVEAPARLSVMLVLQQLKLELLRVHPEYTVDIEPVNSSGTATDWHLMGNETLLRTAFHNLMENGGKFSPDHRVRIRLVAGNGSVTIRFTNNGPVIPADEIATIFKPFRRGTNARKIPGHGIGLSMTERIVWLHQGQITVDSSPETGTTFTVILPK